jgi:hypothetical protein
LTIYELVVDLYNDVVDTSKTITWNGKITVNNVLETMRKEAIGI